MVHRGWMNSRILIWMHCHKPLLGLVGAPATSLLGQSFISFAGPFQLYLNKGWSLHETDDQGSGEGGTKNQGTRHKSDNLPFREAKTASRLRSSMHFSSEGGGDGDHKFTLLAAIFFFELEILKTLNSKASEMTRDTWFADWMVLVCALML